MGKEYKFDGSVYKFLGMMQWTLTVRKAYEEGHPEGFKVATDPEVNKKVAEEYGITEKAVLYELVRLGKEAEGTLEYNLYEMDRLKRFSNGRTFLSQLKSGDVEVNEIDDFIEYWHRNQDEISSPREYPGLSEEQFSKWAKEGNEILLEFI